MALASNVIKHDMNVVPGPIFYDYSLYVDNLLQHQKPTFYFTKYSFIQVLSKENMYDMYVYLNMLRQ